MELMEVLTALLTITLPIIATIVLTNRQTLRLLQEIKTTQEGIKQVQADTTCLLRKVRDTQERMVKVQADTTCLLRKLDFGLKANALMHGWERADNISPEQARKLPEPKAYDPELRVCYYKPA